jgi:alkanesulfonate monooxygenase SsuD/methylene tetrahydromethanopterin reductase-like flavin-dependent oxidoreductase (luciferase family)
MHLGLMMECEYRPGATDDTAFDEAFTLAAAAEELGYDTIWLAERHFASPERISGGSGGGVPSFASAPLMFASALAARTSRVRIGIAVSVLPLAHPVKLAEEVATLDQISRGRLDFGIGRSGFATAYAGYAVPYGESRERFQECLDILRAAWTQDSFSYSGEHYQFEDVALVPKPYQKPYPPLRMAATTPDTFPIVGEMGFPIFVGLRGTDVPETARNVATYREAWHAAGHPGDGDVYLRIPVYVAATEDAALEEPRASTMQSYKRLAESYVKSAGTTGTVAAEGRAARGESMLAAGYDELLRNRLAYGTPEMVATRLKQLRDDIGLSGFVIEPNVGGSIPRPQVFESVRLIATEVAPALRA